MRFSCFLRVNIVQNLSWSSARCFDCKSYIREQKRKKAQARTQKHSGDPNSKSTGRKERRRKRGREKRIMRKEEGKYDLHTQGERGRKWTRRKKILWRPLVRRFVLSSARRNRKEHKQNKNNDRRGRYSNVSRSFAGKERAFRPSRRSSSPRSVLLPSCRGCSGRWRNRHCCHCRIPSRRCGTTTAS